ncbi:hypothetical protein SDC9_176681 [bioreactor metagenome]|uniref:Uncharacterized protein n=1 Tax=bioreactor metagenome TaxID=1076179 RepID=A0A645GSG9_9ZZZZ
MHEARILERLDVVIQTDPPGVACSSELAEGEIDALEKRIDEANAERRERGQQKQRKASLNRASDEFGAQG